MRFKPFEKGLVLCIDPGLRLCGMAIFSPDGRLLRAGMPESKIEARTHIRGARAWRAMALCAKEWVGTAQPVKVIVEEQRIDSRTPNADDMLQVNGVAGACTMLFHGASVQGYWPETWKGSIPKEDMTARIKARMQESPEENAKIEYENVMESKRHNILDAIGIGLYHFVRLDPRRVIHR